MNNENELLNKAYENVRMASFAIDCIIEKIESPGLATLLRKQNKFYLETTLELEELSKALEIELKDINPMLKGMSYVSIKMKTIANNDSPKLAEMLIQGTTMGVTDTLKAKNEFEVDNNKLTTLVDKIITHEEKFVDSLKTFL